MIFSNGLLINYGRGEWKGYAETRTDNFPIAYEHFVSFQYRVDLARSDGSRSNINDFTTKTTLTTYVLMYDGYATANDWVAFGY